MRASTEYKALLRYLYCREMETKQVNIDINEVLDEIYRLEKEVGDYGLSNLGDAYSYESKMHFSYLDRMGMIKYYSKNPNVELTELGRCFASQLELPGALEIAIPKILSTSANNR